MKRVLVTGGAGFVGANLVHRLVADGHSVFALVSPQNGSWRLKSLADRIEEVPADLRDAAQMSAVVQRIKPEWVFHLAAHGAYSWQKDVAGIMATNVTGTVNLVEACLATGVEAFVNTGSSSEYGFQDHAPLESDAVEPNSIYAVSKVSATMFCRCRAHQTGTRMPTLRLYSVFGPWEDPRRLMPAVLLHGLAGRYSPLTDPTTARDFIYTDDVVDAYLLAATKPLADPGAVYNVGSGRQTTLREVAAASQEMFGIAGEPNWGSMASRSWDTNVWVSNPQKIRTELGWEPKFSLPEGMKRFADWFRQDPGRIDFYRGQMAPTS